MPLWCLAGGLLANLIRGYFTCSGGQRQIRVEDGSFLVRAIDQDRVEAGPEDPQEDRSDHRKGV